jgi:hypothetical protein
MSEIASDVVPAGSGPAPAIQTRENSETPLRTLHQPDDLDPAERQR